MRNIIYLFIFLILIGFVNADLKNDVVDKLDGLEDEVPKDTEIFLPAAVKVIVVGGEDFMIELNKDKEYNLIEKEKYDVSVSGYEEDYYEILNLNSMEEVNEIINKFEIEAKTFKGRIAIEFTKEFNDLNFNYDADMISAFIGIVMKPIVALFWKCMT